MLSMDHQASPSAADTYHTAAAQRMGGGHNDENAEPRQRNIPVPVLVKHEEFAAATLMSCADHSGDESSSSARSTTGTGNSSNSKRAREKRSTKSKCPPGLRSGKWTPEEEAFTNMIIYYFKLGRLHVEDGTSLRWYLAKRLNCEAMRVTKKLKGNSSIGKQIFRALEDTSDNRRAIDEANEELLVLEKAFVDSLTATGQPATTPTNGAGKRASPHKPVGHLKHPPNLEARKLIVPKIRDSLANREDAKLLLHFFEEAQDSAGESSTTVNQVEKKRLFSDVDTSPSTSSSSTEAGDSPTAKRQAAKMESLDV